MGKRGSDELDDSDDTPIKNMRTENNVTLIIKPKDSSDSLSKVSPYKLWASIKSLIGDNFEILPLNKFFKVKMAETQASTLSNLEKIEGIDISVEREVVAKEVKGIIHGIDITIPVENLVEGFNVCNKDIKIKEIIRFEKNKVPIPTIMLKIAGEVLPQDLKFGYRNYKVKEFVPRPIRCFKCQRFGHTSGNCHSIRRCKKCGGNHELQECTENIKCVNCKGPHDAGSFECPFFLEAKEILRVKTTKKISYSDAVKTVRQTNSDLPKDKSRIPRQIPTSSQITPQISEHQSTSTQAAAPEGEVILVKDLVVVLFKVFSIFAGMEGKIPSRTFFVSRIVEEMNASFHLNVNTEDCLKSLGLSPPPQSGLVKNSSNSVKPGVPPKPKKPS